MMCRYAKYRAIKDNFIRAALRAECPKMKAIWIHKAEVMQSKIDNLSDSDAMEIVSND